MPVSTLPCPGSQAAKTCGILAFVFALTCVGFPIASSWAFTALVQQRRPSAWPRPQPGTYEPVSSVGLVTGIIGLVLPVFMLPVVGIVSAINRPGLPRSAGASREMAVRSNCT